MRTLHSSLPLLLFTFSCLNAATIIPSDHGPGWYDSAPADWKASETNSLNFYAQHAPNPVGSSLIIDIGTVLSPYYTGPEGCPDYCGAFIERADRESFAGLGYNWDAGPNGRFVATVGRHSVATITLPYAVDAVSAYMAGWTGYEFFTAYDAQGNIVDTGSGSTPMGSVYDTTTLNAGYWIVLSSRTGNNIVSVKFGDGAVLDNFTYGFTSNKDAQQAGFEAPEPSTLGLLSASGLGLIALSVMRRRSRSV